MSNAPAPNAILGRTVRWTTNAGQARTGRVVDLSTAYGVDIAKVETTDGFVLTQVWRLEVAA